MLRKTLFLLSAVGFAVLSNAGDWTQWRGSNRDLLIEDEAVAQSWPAGGPKQLWQVDIEGDGYSEPIVVGGKIYITGCVGDKKNRKGKIYCLNAKDGSPVWDIEYGPEWGKNFERARTTPTYFKGGLFVISGVGDVICLKASDGSVVWKVDAHKKFGSRNITWGIAENPLIYDGKLICQPGGSNAVVVALDIKTGKAIWKSSSLDERSAYCSPALLTINGKKQVVTSLEHNTVGLDASTGKLIWKYSFHNKYAVHPNTPVLCGKDRVFISSGYKYGAEVIEIKGSNVKQLWKEDKASNHFQGVAFYKGRIFSASDGKGLWCFNPATGKPAYIIKEAKKSSFCILKDGMMITYDEKGGNVLLLKVDASKYEIKGEFKIGYGNNQHWSSPVVSDGVMYLRHGKGFGAFKVGK
ncbi:MAG: PQQ-binding-like beta-propeller repeat protein [Kiritimatiellae bacterium]|nr:PQQ-binding-like beta-propeller repeat protein [Kiritimatiellia bacterium]